MYTWVCGVRRNKERNDEKKSRKKSFETGEEDKRTLIKYGKRAQRDKNKTNCGMKTVMFRVN